MQVFVVIATVGRPETVCQVVEHLARQTRLPNGVIVVSVATADVTGVASCSLAPEILFSPKGLCIQRNRALDALRGRADLILFLDDDFVPADDYVAQLEALFIANPGVVGATGRIIADGIGHSGFSFTEATELVDRDRPPATPIDRPAEALYGCNMAIRTSALGDLRFDEALPLYGWLEDIDLTYRLGRRGPMLRSDRIAGVHMGEKRGRTSGRKLGYSQIANPVYMLRKRSAPPKLAWGMMFRNFAANLAGSIRRDTHVDRIGRLRGNLAAIGDLVTARLDPRNILRLT